MQRLDEPRLSVEQQERRGWCERRWRIVGVVVIVGVFWGLIGVGVWRGGMEGGGR
jgi:hypothetical protein